MSLTIRQAKVADRDEVSSFLNSVIPLSIDPQMHDVPAVVGNVNSNLDVWVQTPEEVLHLIAENEGDIVGSLLVKNYWNLCSMFVHPGFQRIGIGRALLSSALGECRSKSPKKAVYLNANDDALAFYKKLGFEPRESHKFPPAGSTPMQYVFY